MRVKKVLRNRSHVGSCAIWDCRRLRVRGFQINTIMWWGVWTKALPVHLLPFVRPQRVMPTAKFLSPLRKCSGYTQAASKRLVGALSCPQVTRLRLGSFEDVASEVDSADVSRLPFGGKVWLWTSAREKRLVHVFARRVSRDLMPARVEAA